ncbi:hypermethylated in cancer 1 protein isoform X1 [Microcaecilia unicolor]|uniref:Hypermethylated in cancer 1 protein n=1 Tax=Microcaecilia unicolor TaxID=1415580 RepID=A0A6P7WFT4_9AMPH|nr:hypermethylated in cancer 1 protein isoform X1 [Microcaecilia unicolor]
MIIPRELRGLPQASGHPGVEVSAMLDAMEVPSHARHLLLQLNSQRTKGFLCDVIIVVQNALFRAHKNILAASSAYLKSLVVHDNLINLDHELVSPGIFRAVLDFIYTGRLSEAELGLEPSLAALLAAATYLQIADLVTLCKKQLKRSGKYRQLRSSTYGPYSKVLPCYPPRAPAPAPAPPAPPLDTHRAELYAAGPQGPSLPLCGLDLTKKSPPGPSVHGTPEGATTQAPDPIYRWMKPEPQGGPYPEPDEDKSSSGGGCEEEEEEEEEEEGDTGSSEEPPGPGPGPGYEPESLGHNVYVCIPCGQGFPSSEQLNAHVEAHAEGDPPGEPPGDPRPYHCGSCHKSYKDPATLRQHEKTHWLSRPYPCTICGKKFTQRGTMTRHMRSHLGLKPFACDACGMRFTRQYRLTEHMRIHSGEKPYECQVCGGRFAQQRNLLSHMKMHGPGGPADSLLAVARLGAQQLAHASPFLSDASALDSLYPLAKFTAEHLGLSQDKAIEVLHHDGRLIDRFSPA